LICRLSRAKIKTLLHPKSSMPIFLECQRCTACCRWPGEVRVDETEISKLASFKGMSDQAFIEQHTRLRLDRRGLALKERSDGSCAFLDGASCAVQPVKPQQCKEFPSRWVNSLWGKFPLETIQRDYPMLFACSAFKAFIKTNKS
jgi:Fe-S-cluster containining protein